MTTPLPPLTPWNGFDLMRDNRTAAAVRQIAGIVADRQWHRVSDMVAVVASDNELLPRTVAERIRELVKRKQLLRRGRFGKGAGRDMREVRLSPVWMSQVRTPPV